jgi:hypothetical protein
MIAIIASMVGSNGSLTPLDGDQLRSLLHNVMLRTVRPGIISSDPELERFEENGTYVRYFDRVRATGSFEIRADTVCVRLPNRQSENCRRIFRDETGRLFAADTGVPTRPMVRLEISGVGDGIASTTLGPIAGTNGEGPMHLRPVNGSELRATLTNVFLTTLHPELRDGNATERFGGDGLYVRHFDRVRATGTFEIVGDSFCVRLPSQQSENCRRLFRDESGQLFASDSDVPVRSIVRVEISRVD